MHTRTLDISQFEHNGNKKEGVTSGFTAQKDNIQYLIKEFKNGNLTQDEKKERLKEFEKNFYQARERELENVITSKYLRKKIAKLLTYLAKRKLCYNEMSVGDCIREYITAPIYRELLSDDAPEVFLVIDDKDPNKIYLASKFLDKSFTTVLDHIKNKTDAQYQSAEGYERILAAQILLGESDVSQFGNFGTIKDITDKKLHFAKIDHGKSLCYSEYHTLAMALYLACVRSKGININLSILESELEKQSKILEQNYKKIEDIIKRRVADLEENLNKDLKFTLRYIGGHNVLSPFGYKRFQYDDKTKHFITKSGQTLEDHFLYEFRIHQSRANVLYQARNEAIICVPFVILSAISIYLAKFFEHSLKNHIGDKSQKAILGIAISALCICTILLICFTTAQVCLIHQLDKTKPPNTNFDVLSSLGAISSEGPNIT
jgi:hypothetical protein